MRIFKNKSLTSYTFLLFYLFLIEIIFRLISKTTIFNISLLRVFFLTNIISIILGYFTSLFSRKNNHRLNLIIIFIFTIYTFVQMGFYTYIGVYMSLGASSQLGAVVSYILDFIKAIRPEYYFVFIPFILSLITIIVISKIRLNREFVFKVKKRFKYDNLILTTSYLIILISSSGLFYHLLDNRFMVDDYQVVSNKKLFLTGSNPSLCIKEFGVIPFSFIDLYSNKTDNAENVSLDYLALVDEKENKKRKFDDASWNTLISEETNTNLNNLNNYFINNYISDTNENTGIFENKNVIVIMMESVNDIIDNETYYPNFYKLAHNGWYFTNNYSPRNSCATGNNEFSALSGLYSIYNDCTANTYMNNTYYEALFNLFNNKGYQTNSVHDFTESYYYRGTIHPNMGSQKYYGVQDLGIDYFTYYGGWASDIDAMNSYLNIIDQRDTSKNFMTYFISVSSHQPYGDSFYGNLNYSMTDNTNYTSDIRHYMSKLKVLDDALGVLTSGLEERKLLDDTVLVLFGDHYPYGINIESLSEVLTRPLIDYENEKVPLVIYNPSLESKTFDIYTSYINLTPTLANLFNLDYDPRLYTGTDIFDENYNNIVVFADSSWKNDLAYYNASTGQITYYTDFTYTGEEIISINKEIYAKMSASSLAIKNNYFNYLESSLKEINERTN